MREFVFAIEYDSGHDPVMDVFIEYPETIATTVACSVTTDSVWRIDRLSGSEMALSRLEDLLCDSERCSECPFDHDCDPKRRTEVLMRAPTHRTIYTYQSDIEDCDSLPSLAATHLGDGVFYAATRREARYEWRILLPDETRVGGLYDEIRDTLPDDLRLSLTHLRQPTYWADEALTAADLPTTQRAALKVAVENGYYETPRATDLALLADRLDVPRSTFQYRLRRAEAWVTTRFVEECL